MKKHIREIEIEREKLSRYISLDVPTPTERKFYLEFVVEC